MWGSRSRRSAASADAGARPGSWRRRAAAAASANAPLTSLPVLTGSASATLSAASAGRADHVRGRARVVLLRDARRERAERRRRAERERERRRDLPPTPPCVQSERLTSWPRAILTVVVSSTVPSGAVQVERVGLVDELVACTGSGAATGSRATRTCRSRARSSSASSAFGNARTSAGWPGRPDGRGAVERVRLASASASRPRARCRRSPSAAPARSPP